MPMNSDLPATGTAALLELLAPFILDDFINECWPHNPTGGRHCEHTAAQLYRVHLLCLLSPVHSVNLLVKMLPEQRAWRKLAGLRRQGRVPDVRMMHQFRSRVGVAGLRRINQHLLAPLLTGYLWQPWSVGLIDATDLPAACVGFKKKHRAILCRTCRVGRAHAQVGTKPLLRRLQETHAAPVAAPVPGRSATGAARQLGDSGQCFRGRAVGAQSALLPSAMGLVSTAGRGGHGIFGGQAKQQCRERWRVAVLTKLRSDMKLVPPYVAWDQAACPQGEPLTWLGYDGRAEERWFGVGAEPELCSCCWEAARCPRQFAHPPAQHETLLGRLPLASRVAQQVLRQMRPWIEPAQSFEKNQLGLGDVFFNSLRFTWLMSLLADAAVLLRARALLGRPPLRPLLAGLMPVQLPLELEIEAARSTLQTPNPNP